MVQTVFAKDRSMPHACRAALYFFEGDDTFDWTFISPPWFYREGPKTNVYGTVVDYQPVDEKGRWLGINSGDIAVAIADEAERREKKWTHWSTYGRQEDTS
jgi:putative NADH-flavin reductase